MSSVGYARVSAALTLEICRNVVSEIESRSELAKLCQVSQGFRTFAEHALYNTLYMRNVQGTLLLCRTLSDTQRLSELVDALTIFADQEEDLSEGDSDSEVEAETSYGLPPGYWSSVAGALEHTTNLQYLNIHITNNGNASTAWTLSKCTFQLRGFHCDFNWDNHLISFLNKQHNLDDLFLVDYLGAEDTSAPTPEVTSRHELPILSSSAFPRLSILECTFSEAAIAIVPERPITRLKTCFSRARLDEKRAEMTELLTKIRLSSRPLRALDIADSAYTTSFSMELLSSIASSRATSSELRYLGTLVLPISGRERLKFYGLLMRLPRIQCIEVEVSDWVPPPSTPPAFRALASEMRLYTPSVSRVVFVRDFNRTVVTVVDGVCQMDNDANYELLWRDT